MGKKRGEAKHHQTKEGGDMNLFITGTGTGVGKTQVCATWARSRPKGTGGLLLQVNRNWSGERALG